MSIIPASKCISCFFEPYTDRSYSFPAGEVEVFYGITKDLCLQKTYLENYLSLEQKIRAGRFHCLEEQDTYICCHGLLRLILSDKLKKDPNDIVLNYDENNKPGLSGNPIYFNITHTNGAFAFVISKYFYVGIDMENTDRSIDFVTIINTYFSNIERNYVLSSGNNKQELFYLLWTRKEALLKAIGTGLTTTLTQFEVSENDNTILTETFDNNVLESIQNEHFIYSEKVLKYILSISIPQKADIYINQVHTKDITYYLSLV
jgi:4'-phosphopantetheinyl transferase